MTNDKNIRWGMIGCGEVSHRFMQGLLNASHNTLTSVWSRRPEQVSSFVQKYGGVACASFDDLLAEDIDAVYIATLPDSHAFYSIAALNAGKHVLCEKPSAINVNKLDEIIETANARKLLFMEGMKSPFFPLYRQLKEYIQTDPIGEVGYVRAGSSVTGIRADHPNFSHELAGGSLMGIGIYEAFLALDWLGETKQIQTMGKLGPTGIDVFAIFQTEHENGYGQFYTGFEVHGKGDALICGTLGNITIHKNWWNPTRATIDYADGRVVEIDTPFIAGGFNYEIDHFCDLIRNNLTESPIVSHDMSRSMISMLDKARAAIGLKFNGE
jgi:predicted dehydrogenase